MDQNLGPMRIKYYYFSVKNMKKSQKQKEIAESTLEKNYFGVMKMKYGRWSIYKELF